MIGTLREEGLLDNTAILLTADHGDMIGDHGLYAKKLFYESSACVPSILVCPRGDMPSASGTVSENLFCLADVMPTLLAIAGIPAPETCEGISMLGSEGRSFVYGECLEDKMASRMVREGPNKLIWYPAGNVVQLFDVVADPQECRDLSDSLEHAETRQRLESLLMSQLYGVDLEWVEDGRLIGFDPPELPTSLDNRGLSGQRGAHYPPIPVDLSGTKVGFV